MVAQQFKHAAGAIGFAIEQQRNGVTNRPHAGVSMNVALSAVESIKKRRKVEHLRTMLKEVAVEDGVGVEGKVGSIRGAHLDSILPQPSRRSHAEEANRFTNCLMVQRMDVHGCADPIKERNREPTAEVLAEFFEPFEKSIGVA